MSLPGHNKDNVGRYPPPYAFIMDNFETWLSTTVDKTRGNARGTIVERFIKPKESTVLGHQIYFLDEPRLSIAVSVSHE